MDPTGGVRGGLFWAQNASNFAITGGGTVDGAGGVWNTDFAHRSNMFIFSQCADVRIENLQIHNSSMWTLVPMFSRRLVFRNLHISEGRRGDGQEGRYNTDGMSPRIE